MNTKFFRYFSPKKYALSVMALAFLLFLIESFPDCSAALAFARGKKDSPSENNYLCIPPDYCDPVSVGRMLYSCLQIPGRLSHSYAPEEYHAVLGINKVASDRTMDLSVYSIKNLPLAKELSDSIVWNAKQCLEVSYLPGGTSPETGFDCSGYVFYIFHRCGYRFTERSCNDLYKKCSIITPEEALPGDLVFFRTTTENRGYTHVGIYIGEGKMLHAGMNGICAAYVNNEYWIQHMPSFCRLYPEAALQ